LIGYSLICKEYNSYS